MPVLTSDPAAESGVLSRGEDPASTLHRQPPLPLQLEHLHRGPCCPRPEAPWELFSKTHQNKSLSVKQPYSRQSGPAPLFTCLHSR